MYLKSRTALGILDQNNVLFQASPACDNINHLLPSFNLDQCCLMRAKFCFRCTLILRFWHLYGSHVANDLRSRVPCTDRLSAQIKTIVSRFKLRSNGSHFLEFSVMESESE